MLSLEKRDHLAWLTLNRPEKLNAMEPSFFPAFREKINSLDEDQDARVIVLKAEGKSFTSGLDLLEAGDLLQIQGAWRREKLRQRILDLQNCFSVLENISTPVIAAVHGHCIGMEKRKPEFKGN